MTASKTSAKKHAKKASEEEQTELPASLIPAAGRESFPLHELAEILRCSIKHLSSLVDQKEISVPQESIDRATSRSRIQVPRTSIVDFLRRRYSRNFVRQGRKKAQRKKTLGRKHATR